MTDRPVLIPTTAHPITVEPTGGRVVIRVDGDVIAETDAALTLREASYPAVHYVPLVDVAASRLVRSEHRTYCPFKGEASYFSIAGVPEGANAVWSYEHPYDEVAAIREALAFYPNKVKVRVERA